MANQRLHNSMKPVNYSKQTTCAFFLDEIAIAGLVSLTHSMRGFSHDNESCGTDANDATRIHVLRHLRRGTNVS
jgi:hypothetical protein